MGVGVDLEKGLGKHWSVPKGSFLSSISVDAPPCILAPGHLDVASPSLEPCPNCLRVRDPGSERGWAALLCTEKRNSL